MARRSKASSITAAAKRVDLSIKPSRRRREAWQEDAWAAYDEVPEVKELLLWRSDQIAKLKLYAAIRLSNDERQEPVPLDSEAVKDAGINISDETIALVMDEVAALRTEVGGQAEILRRADLNLEVAGECFLIGFNAYDPILPAEWIVASTEETTVVGGVRYYGSTPAELSSQTARRAIRDKIDDFVRIWQPHARFYGLADCAMRAALTEAELIGSMTNQLLAESRSRTGAGFLTIPNELAVQLPGGHPISAAPQPDGEERKNDDPVMTALMEGMMEPASDPSHASAIVPIVIRGPADALKADALRAFTTARPVDRYLDQRIESRILRLARGLSAPPEKILGLDKTTFANADQVDQDTWDEYLQPRAEFLVQALTVGYLMGRPSIQALDADIRSRLVVWYDASAVIQQPDTSGSNADEAFDRGMISDEAYRRARGYAEDDAATPEERFERAALKTTLTVDLAAKLLEGLAGTAEPPIDISEWAVPGAAAPAATDPAAAMALLSQFGMTLAREGMFERAARRALPASSVTAAAPRSRFLHSDRPGRRLTALDRDLRTRTLVAANGAMARALEKAANKLRTKHPNKAEARALPARELARYMGRSAVTAALGDDPWDDAWTTLGVSWLAWTAAARSQVISVVSGLVGGFTVAQKAALDAKMTAGAEEAWTWLSDTLTGLADRQLFDPSVLVPALGEFDASLAVPAGAIRQAVARAGGTAGLDTSQGGAWVTLTSGGGDAGGYAFGQTVSDTLTADGAGVEGYVWDYGPGLRRTFEPHLALDGVEFVNFDDEVLANNEGWPEFSYFIPGDHDGCLCDATPIIIPADAMTEAA